MINTILVTELAHDTVFNVSRRCIVETGGVLVGILGNPLVVVAAGQPGLNAIHNATRFTTDPEADTECISQWRKMYGPVIEVLGWYHKHYFLQEPSGGDLYQVRQLQNEFRDNRPILMGIVSENGLFKKNLKLRIFGLDDGGEQIEYHWKIIPNNSPEIEKAIKSIPLKPEIKDTHFWNDSEFQSYKNPVGRKRICHDIQQLKQYGWHTLVCRSKTHDSLMLRVMNDRSSMYLLIPPEYPLNPPIVLTWDNKRIFNLQTLCEWNSMAALLDIVCEADQIQNCPLCRNRHLIAR